jgi:hypothetical protein
LTRLRVGFVVLGAALLLPLFFVLRQAEARLEEQRRLRHEIVAERIFDEMERDLSTLLEAERSRPSSAYDAPSTRVAAWAPFVVGYFTRDRQGLRLLAPDQLAAARALRLQGALATLDRGLPSEPEAQRPAPAAEATQSEKNQQELLRQLNRGRKLHKRAPATSVQDREDPLMGL